MDDKAVEIRFVDAWPEEEIVALYKAAGWWKEAYDKSKIKTLITDSYAFAVAVDSRIQEAVGMGRVLSDGISDAYIQDLVVSSKYQGLGIGKKLVNSLIQHCLSNGIHWIGVIVEPGNESFYKNLGFKPMKGHIPMLYRMEE